MLLIYLILFIICKSINVYVSEISFNRITAIICLVCGFLTLNIYDYNSLNSGLAIYGGLFHITNISQIFEIILFITGSIILTTWPIIPKKNNEVMNSSTNLETNNKYLQISNIFVDISKFNSYSTNFSLIILFNLLGASLLISSFDFISLYLTIELQSFSLYVLASLYRNSELATSAGLKYFLIGALASCFILFGAGLIYSFTGLTNFDSIFALISSSQLDELLVGIFLAFIFIFVGLFIKIAAAPFHNWSPDVYDNVPTVVTIWLNIIPKLTILILMIEIFSNISIFYINFNWDFLLLDKTGFNHYNDLLILFNWYQNMKINFLIKNLLLIVSLVSLVIGAILGLAQIRIKRLLAYSSINHIGFILLALAINNQNSFDAFFFYIIQYIITNLNIFLIIIALSYFVKYIKVIKNNNFNLYIKDIRYIHELKSLFFSNPLLAIALSISLFSMAGIGKCSEPLFLIK